MIRDKLVDKINQLYESGYTSDYPPLRELLDWIEEIDCQSEFYGRLGEVSCEI